MARSSSRTRRATISSCFEAPGSSSFAGPSEPDATLVADRTLSQPGRVTLLPRLLEDVFLQRPDVRALAPGELLFPRAFLDWCRNCLEPEYGDRAPLFRSSLLAVHRGEHAELLRGCREFLPGVPEAWIADALVHGRSELRALLLAHRAAAPDPAPLDALIGRIKTGRHLVVAVNPVVALRMMLSTWPTQFQLVPALGDGAIADFRAHVRRALAEHFHWPAAHERFLDYLDPEASLARVLSVLRRRPVEFARLRQTGFNRELLVSLVPFLAAECDFDAADLALLDWLLNAGGTRAACGGGSLAPRGVVPRLRSLLRARADGPAPKPARKPAPCSPGAEEPRQEAAGPLSARLLPLLADESVPAHWDGYLSWLAARHNLGGGRETLTELRRLVESAGWSGLGRREPRAGPGAARLNIFGYFKSPIGLGQMSRGIASAQSVNGILAGDRADKMTMTSDFRLEDLDPDFAFEFRAI